VLGVHEDVIKSFNIGPSSEASAGVKRAARAVLPIGGSGKKPQLEDSTRLSLNAVAVCSQDLDDFVSTIRDRCQVRKFLDHETTKNRIIYQGILFDVAQSNKRARRKL